VGVKDRELALLERKLEESRKRLRDTEARKTYDEVFNHETLLAVYTLFSDGVVETIDFPIATGKEGNVFRASNAEGRRFAVKIYRTSTATFRDLQKYIVGDSRFKGLSGSRRKLIYAWAQKEYRNLERFTECGVRVPAPVAVHKNILVMEYIGTEDQPAPELRNVQVEDPAELWEELVEAERKAWTKGGIVHGDLSEYNVLVSGPEWVLIDVGQAVLRDHSLAGELLERDLKNLARYFRRLGVETDPAAALAAIRASEG